MVTTPCLLLAWANPVVSHDVVAKILGNAFSVHCHIAMQCSSVRLRMQSSNRRSLMSS